MDLAAVIELKVKNDQAKAALAATKGDIKGVGDAAAKAAVDGAKLGSTLATGATTAAAPVDHLQAEIKGVGDAAKAAAADAAKLDAALSHNAGGMAAVSSGSMLAGHNVKLLGMQLSQVGQQTMASGNFVQALAILLPDIGLAFGAVGMAAGLLAGIALPMVMSAFSDTSEDVLAFKEAMDELRGSLDAYKGFAEIATTSTKELRQEFGEFAGEVQSFAGYMAGVQLAKSLDDMKAVIGPLKGELTGVLEAVENVAEARARRDAAAGRSPWVVDKFQTALNSTVADLNEQAKALGITAEQAEKLAAAIDNMGKANGLDEMRDAAAEALDVMREIAPVGQSLPKPLREAAEALNEIVTKTAAATAVGGEHVSVVYDLATALSTAVDAATILAESGPNGGWLSGAIGDARTLASTLWDAAAARAAAAQEAIENNRVVTADGKVIYRDKLYANMVGRGSVPKNQYANPTAKTPGAAKGGGGGRKADNDSFAGLTKSAEDAMAALDVAVAGINEKVHLGLISTAEGTEAIATAKERAAGAIADLIPKLQKASDAAGPKAAEATEHWREAVRGLVTDLDTAGGKLGSTLSDEFGKGFASFLTGAKSGKEAMADFSSFVLQKLADLASQKFMGNVLSPLLDSVMGGLFDDGGGSLLGFANGGAPDAALSAWSNSIVDQPTRFRMRDGRLAEMGEAGREAIMPLSGGGVLAMVGGRETRLPLQRGSGGRLGVRVPAAISQHFARGGVPDMGDESSPGTALTRRGTGTGAGGAGGGPVTVNVINQAAGTRATHTERNDGSGVTIDVLIEQIEGAIAGNLTRGTGSMNDAMQGAFGLTRQGR